MMEKREELCLESFQFGEDEIQNLMSIAPPPETASSFTALLDLPPNQAVKLLHSPEESTTNLFSSSMFSSTETENSQDTMNSIPIHCNLVKQEPIESGSLRNSSPIVSVPVVPKSTKRKEPEKKVESGSKIGENDEQLPYIYVRARRGQATDSHSLAERARREKINAKMKLLQELVPGCNKICGTAMILEEIIKHVQALQRQVEFLSTRLADVQPKIDVDFDTMFSTEIGSDVNCNFSSWLWVDGNTRIKTLSAPNTLR